jgi:distribution and morphology protein 10
VSAVSSNALKDGGSILFLWSRDEGKYSTEWLYSTDSALLGVRGMYNFGPDPRKGAPSPEQELKQESATVTGTEATVTGYRASTREAIGRLNGRFSAGAELYYGLLNKSGGMSTGIRFATLPQHTGFPYTMTLTLNPLMGNISSTYAVRAGQALALCSRFDFNFYSYESEFKLGMELWRRKQETGDPLKWARTKLKLPGVGGWGELVEDLKEDIEQVRPGDNTEVDAYDNGFVGGLKNEDTAGVLKATVNQDGAVGLLWEGKAKELLYSAGVTVDFKRRDQIFRGVGLSIQYSS